MPTTLSAARRQPNFSGAAKSNFLTGGDSNLPKTLNDHLRSLQPYSSRLHFARDEMIFSEDEPADRVYKIVSGVVRICRHTVDGRRHIADFMLPGDFIGFLECADQPTSAEAVTEATLVSYPRNCIDRLAISEPSMRKRILCHLSSSLLEARHHLFVLGCQNAKERVASFLLRLAERLDVMPGERLELPMGRKDIADHLGLTIETVCRSISALKSVGLLAIPNTHQVILSDMRGLRALAIEA